MFLFHYTLFKILWNNLFAKSFTIPLTAYKNGHETKSSACGTLTLPRGCSCSQTSIGAAYASSRRVLCNRNEVFLLQKKNCCPMDYLLSLEQQFFSLTIFRYPDCFSHQKTFFSFISRSLPILPNCSCRNTSYHPLSCRNELLRNKFCPLSVF